MSENGDSFDLARFLRVQGEVYAKALAEIRNGRKRSHWMWFIFPQVDGLGTSHTSVFYSIKSVGEVLAYLKHPVLGHRLIECSSAVLQSDIASAEQIFGSVDAAKLRSSMTLFDHISPGSIFSEVLTKYYAGSRDAKTLQILISMESK